MQFCYAIRACRAASRFAGLAGDVLRIDRGVSNLDDLNFNDAAHSLIAEGRWEICLDAGHAGACRVVQGQITDMGDWNGSISSARYLGPGDWGSASVGGGSLATMRPANACPQ